MVFSTSSKHKGQPVMVFPDVCKIPTGGNPTPTPSLTPDEHPYTQLIINEFRFVSDKKIPFIAHEYLAKHNQSYWRSDFLDLMQVHDFDYVADADFNHSSGRSPEASGHSG